MSEYKNIKKYDKTMLKTAMLWSEESYCKRSKVGSIISKDNRIISVGYNGTVSGTNNNCEHTCDKCGGSSVNDNTITCSKCNNKGIVTSPYTIHAEANAILFAVKSGIGLKGTTIYITKSPCIECAKSIVQSGIVRVVYIEQYKDVTGLEFIERSGVKVMQIEDVS